MTTDRIKYLADQIDDCTMRIHEAKVLRASLRKEFALAACPLKAGQVVTMCGYSFPDRLAEVDSINYWESFRGDHGWSVKAYILKKDGEPGLQSASFTNEQYDRWVENNEKDSD